ncbi:MAG TPA: serine/threonine-protein kinase [Kofleriaceae bacterium]|nr:serine/threonine-protein kinase [Kofleriaceae bacterium]
MDPFSMVVGIVFFTTVGRVITKAIDTRGKRGGKLDGEAVKELEALRGERKLLVERIENLETIVCGVDLELNQKLNKVIDEQRLIASVAPPAAAANAANPKTPPEHDRTMTAPPKAAPTATPGALIPGDVLANRYRIQRLLGKGGMGAVYLAHDEVLGDVVALKVISSAWSSDEAAMIDRFKREAAAARKVSSPNVIRIHDLGEARPGLLYLSMEYVAGRTLADVISSRGLVPIGDCVDVLQQVCTGLAAAHDAGVIHRDLKPGNVLVGERNHVKIIDFGLAKATAAEGMTATGMLLGTPYYMSPEQVRGRRVDASTDIYSLGALAYHLVTGRPPFSGDNAIAVGFAHLSETPPPPKQLRPELPDALESVIMRALAKEPGDRPRTAAEFRDALPKL